MDTNQTEKLKALALAANTDISACARFTATFDPAAVLELIADNERLRARFEYIEDHATTSGGGNGFMVSFFVPVDHEDIGCGIDAAIEKEAPDSHVIPPTRGTGSQQDADEAATNALYLDIMNIPCDESKANEEYSDRRIAYKHGHRDARHAAADLITELASRGCAQGGNTSENSGLLEDPKTAETRIGSSFEGGHLGSAPAAGTDKDAERYRWLRERRVEFSTGWYVGTFSKEDMDKAIDTAIGEHREPT